MFKVAMYSPLSPNPDYYHFENADLLATFLVINSAAYRCEVSRA